MPSLLVRLVRVSRGVALSARLRPLVFAAVAGPLFGVTACGGDNHQFSPHGAGGAASGGAGNGAGTGGTSKGGAAGASGGGAGHSGSGGSTGGTGASGGSGGSRAGSGGSSVGSGGSHAGSGGSNGGSGGTHDENAGAAGESGEDAGGAGNEGGSGGSTMRTCSATEYFDGTECAALTTCTSDQFEAVPPAPDHDRVCKPFTTCGADEYATPGQPGQDHVCTPLTVCAAGTFVSGKPSATTDRVCSACAAGTFSSQLDADACTTWSLCSGAEVESVPPSATSDRVCSTCGSGMYSSGGTCHALTTCTAQQYESQAATATSDRQCTAISNCAAGSSQTAAPTATSNRQCAPCGANTFSTQTNATSCTTWTTCTGSQYQTTAPSATADRACASLTTCSAGQYIKTAATGTSDRVCSACASGTFSTAANSSACSNFTQCNAGTYLSASGSATQDQTCKACASGTFSTTTNAASCKAWKTCGAGQGETVPGSTTSDRTCGACGAGTYGSGGSCLACGSGTYSSTTGATSCSSCSTCGWFPSTACSASADTVCTKQDTARQEGTPDQEWATGAVVDGAGNVWVSATSTPAAGDKALLYKYDSSGNKLKTIDITTSGTDRSYDVVVDTAGNVWVAGTTQNSSHGQIAFAARYGSDGTSKGVLEWGTNIDLVTIAPGLSGDVWMTGSTQLTHITDSAGTLRNTTPGDYTQIVNAPDGIASAVGITVDSNGNPWAVGIDYNGSYIFKGVPSGDVFSNNAKLTEFGPPTYAASPTAVRAVGANIWVVGEARQRYDPNDTSTPSTGFGDDDGYIHRISASDAVAHESMQFGGLGDEVMVSTFVDKNGDLWLGGETNFTFDGKSGKGGYDLLAVRFTLPSAGKAQLTSDAYLVGTTDDDYGGHIAMDGNLRIWLAGGTYGQFPGGVVNAGGEDAFVVEVGK